MLLHAVTLTTELANYQTCYLSQSKRTDTRTDSPAPSIHPLKQHARHTYAPTHTCAHAFTHTFTHTNMHTCTYYIYILCKQASEPTLVVFVLFDRCSLLSMPSVYPSHVLWCRALHTLKLLALFFSKKRPRSRL